MARSSAPKAPDAGNDPAPPSIGRIVHYTLPGGAHRPAIVTSVHPANDHGRPESLTLSVFLEPDDIEEHRGQSVLNVPSVLPESGPEKAGTWHWPELDQ